VSEQPNHLTRETTTCCCDAVYVVLTIGWPQRPAADGCAPGV